MLISFVIFVLI